MSSGLPLGVDFGGSGIKAAPVDLEKGEFAAERVRIPTPESSTPDNVADVLEQLAAAFPDNDGPVGVTVPGIVRHGVIGSAANIDQTWIDTDAAAVFGEALGRPVEVLNDADAAGLAEATYGAARGQAGLVLVTTLGTGIGAALVHDGVLVPNAELGHLWLSLEGYDGGGHQPEAVHAEGWTANSIRERDDLGWDEWAGRLTVFYRTLERLFSPDLLVVGGGVSKKADKFLPKIDIRTPIVPATLRNSAGIVGAALAAQRAHGG